MGKITYETPDDLFDTLHAEFRFDVDVCALPGNAKLPRFYTPEQDGLAQPWAGVCWCNPPFDKTLGLWLRKAWETAQRGGTVVTLFQGHYTDNDWWHNYVLRSSEIRYVRGRPVFRTLEGDTVATRTLIVVFRPECKGPPVVKSIARDGTPNTMLTVSGGRKGTNA